MLSNLKHLSLALQRYASDQTTITTSGSRFPAEVQQLVPDGYLSQKDYSTLTKNMDLSYFPPNTASPSENHLLIIAHIPGYFAYVTVSGQLQLRKIP